MRGLTYGCVLIIILAACSQLPGVAVTSPLCVRAGPLVDSLITLAHRTVPPGPGSAEVVSDEAICLAASRFLAQRSRRQLRPTAVLRLEDNRFMVADSTLSGVALILMWKNRRSTGMTLWGVRIRTS